MTTNHSHTQSGDVPENGTSPAELLDLANTEYLEFDVFHHVDEVTPQANKIAYRRFMGLFIEPESEDLKGGEGKIRKAHNAMHEVFACKTLHRVSALDDFDPTDSQGHIDEAKINDAMEMSVFGEEYRIHRLLSKMRGFPKLYGYGIKQDTPVMVMEWVDGITLAKAASLLPTDEQGRICTRTIAGIGCAVLDALEGTEALQATVVHRDLSPKNIMIRTNKRSLAEQCESNEFDICIIDFGSASLIEEADPAFTMTTDIWRKGTPEYAAPEMLTKDIAKVEELRASSAVDVYALCSILYELYTGHTPYQLADNPVVSYYRYKTENKPLPINERCPEDRSIVHCLRDGLSTNQKKRPTITECLEVFQEYLNGLDTDNRLDNSKSQTDRGKHTNPVQNILSSLRNKLPHSSS